MYWMTLSVFHNVIIGSPPPFFSGGRGGGVCGLSGYFLPHTSAAKLAHGGGGGVPGGILRRPIKKNFLQNNISVLYMPEKC